MGLFDRFRRKVKETPPDEGLLAEPDSEEAQEAISEKLELARKEDIYPPRNSRNQRQGNQKMTSGTTTSPRATPSRRHPTGRPGSWP